MPIERRPSNPLPRTFVPPGGIRYRVQDGDGFVSVARRHNIADVWTLIEFNFRTRSPAEVNWYLRENVGCVRATPDGKNWMFSSDDNPGIIYIPPARERAPVGDGEFVFREGDTLESVAWCHGHIWETIWDDDANEAVREARLDKGNIIPGDRLHIPPIRPRDESAPVEQRTRFRRKGEPIDLGILELYLDLRPGEVSSSEEAFTLEGSGGCRPYRTTRSIKDDAVAGDQGVSLVFYGMPMDATYTLTVELADGTRATPFQDVPFLELHKVSDDLIPEAVRPN
ncbi:MAG: LysM peptidoglycan-binding domain-containing protein [Planctomycetota bacterium]|nr:LysM peptidoglycan-binding domain-containing protein [Planctomycetota bacterium]